MDAVTVMTRSQVKQERTILLTVEKAQRRMNELNDEQLMQHVSRKDVPAFRQLYERYGGRVLGLSIKIVGDRALAEEITQETFWRIWHHAEAFHTTRGTFQNWLFGIARNLAIDTLRRHRQLHLEPFVEVHANGEGRTRPLQDEQDVVESALLSVQQGHVQEALACLPEEQRQVIDWIYFQGKTRREIALEMGIPFGTINTRARLALQKLRHALVERGYEFEDVA